MFLKNNLHPIAVGAGASSNATLNRSKQNDAFLFAGSSETDDFNSFSQTTSHEEPRRRSSQGRPASQRKPSGPNKMMIIGIAVAIAVIALIALIIVVVLTSDRHIKFTNNAYFAYADENANYFVNVNGKAIEHEFEGDVKVIPSADRSFAYIEETTADGISVYLLKGKNLKLLTMSPVSEICSYAMLKPGVLYINNDQLSLYSEKLGDTYIAKGVEAEYCMISGDASTVVYTKEKKNNAAETELYIYVDGSANNTRFNCKPVAISNYGDYIYAAAETEESTALYYITTKNQESKEVPASAGFSQVLMLNRKGDEIIFATQSAEKNNSTAIFRLRKEETVVMAPTVLSLCTVDPSIAVYDTFADTYFTGTITNEEGQTANPTYQLSKKFECAKISSYSGQFSNDGDYFYYVNADQELIQMDLTDSNRQKKSLFVAVTDFTVTQKGNVYVLNEDEEIRYYKRSTGVKDPISPEADDISFYPYANKVYFSTEEDAGVIIYSSEEGSDPEIAKFGKTQISGVPNFTQPYSKKSYVWYYSDDDSAYMLFYTSNGKTFELISQNCIIDGADYN